MAEKNKKKPEADTVVEKEKKTTSGKSTSKLSKIDIFGNKVHMLVAVIVLLVVLFSAVFSVGIYKFGWKDDITLEVARVVPYPAFFVNGKTITYAKYQDYNKAYTTYIKEFYFKGDQNGGQSIDPNSDEGKKILAQSKDKVKEILVRNAIVREEVKKRKISYSDKEINDAFKEFVQRTGGDKEVENTLKKYYGLTVEKFKREFFVDTFLNGKLQKAIGDDKSLNADAEKKANEVLAKVKKGEDFAELAKKYSEDTTASAGGDLGFVKKGTLVPEFEDALWKLQPGQTSELVKTVYGYHIIKLVEVKGEERKASHILIKTRDFETWMADQVKNAKVKSWIN